MFEKIKALFSSAEDYDSMQEKIEDLEKKEKQFGEFNGFLSSLSEVKDYEELKGKIQTARDFIDETDYPFNFGEVAVKDELDTLLSKETAEDIKSGVSDLQKKIKLEEEKQPEQNAQITTENLLNQEICAVGDYGDKGQITEADLDAMVSNSQTLAEKIKPPLKFGHSEDNTGLPALGWATNLRREGEKLLADFKDVPKKIGEIMRAGGYRRVSPEIYTDEVEGAKPPILRAVALLGQDIPQIKNLKDLNVMYNDEGKHAGSLIVPKDKYSEEKDKSGGENMDKKKLEELEKTTAQLRKENVDMKVNKFIEDNKKKILPTQEPIVRQLLAKTFDEKEPVVKYSEGEGDNKKDVELNTAQAVQEIIKRIPDVVDFEEKGKSGGKEETVFDKVQKYAEDNEVTIKEAREALEKKGVDLTENDK